MSPLGTQRTIAILIFLSPWIYVPSVSKDIFFIVAGILLYLSTLDIRRRALNFPEEKTESNPKNEQSA